MLHKTEFPNPISHFKKTNHNMHKCIKLIPKSKELKSNNFYYRKVGRETTILGAIEKNPVLIYNKKHFIIKRNYFLIQ